MNEDRKVEGRKEEMNEDTKVKKIGVETGVRDSACEVFTGWWCTRTIRAKVRREGWASMQEGRCWCSGVRVCDLVLCRLPEFMGYKS